MKKKPIVRRPRTGVGAIPVDSFEKAKFHIHYELAPKDASQILKDYVKSLHPKVSIASLPEWKFSMPTHFVAAAFWKMKDLPIGDRENAYMIGLSDYIKSLIAEVKEISTVVKPTVVKLSPVEMLKRKVFATVMRHVDELEDSGFTAEIDLFALFRTYDLKGAAVPHVRPTIEFWRTELIDAIEKNDEQCVEAYAHLTKKELTRRIAMCDAMLADLDRIRDSAKATRKVSKPKARSVTSQTKNLKFKKEDSEFKLTSVNPISIVGAMRLLAFNTKTRVLTEFISEHPDGFEVSGTTLKRFDSELSRSKKLRKPEEFLAMAMKRTPKQFTKEFDALTTKASVPNGRIGSDHILLRVK